MSGSDKGVVCCFGRDGLGNRMLTAELACRQALVCGKGVHIDWEDEVMKLSFESLARYFDVDGLVWWRSFDASVPRSLYPEDRALWNHRSLTCDINEVADPSGWKSKAYLWSRFAQWRRHYRYKNGRYAFRNGEHLGELLFKHEALLMYCSVPEREPEHFRHFKISSEFKSGLDAWCEARGLRPAPEVAIHVRHTDKSEASLEQLRLALYEQHHWTQDTRVHLATDNAAVIEKMKAWIGDKVTLQYFDLERASDPMHLRDEDKTTKEVGLAMALREMLILSKSKEFWYQEASSFSRVALALAGSEQRCFSWTKGVHRQNL